MSDQFDPNAAPQVKGPFSVAKSAKITGGAAGGITGFTIAANYIAPLILEYAKRYNVPIPVEFSVGVVAGLIAGFIAFVYDIARFRGWTSIFKTHD